MDNTDTKAVLWANAQALMKREWGKVNLTRLAREADFGPATATRIKLAQTSVGLDVIESIAKVFGTEPWQLLAPDLGAKLYVIEDSRVVPLFGTTSKGRGPPQPGGNQLHRTDEQKRQRSDEDRRQNPDRRNKER